MNTNTPKTHRILLGLGLLGVSSLLGTLPSAQAAPQPGAPKGAPAKVTQVQYHPSDRHDNDRPGDRSGDRHDNDQQDNGPRTNDSRNNDHHEDARPNFNHNGPGFGQPGFNPRDNSRDDHPFGSDNRGPIGSNRPLNAGGFGGSNRNGSTQTLSGTVTNDLKGNDFILNGSTRVMMASGQPGSLNQGDHVQVSGYYSNGVFRAQHLTFLRNR